MRKASRDLDPAKVRALMKEFRRNEAAFYRRYGGGRSTIYDLLDEEGRSYPPAAIAQAALGRTDIKGGLKHSDSAGVALRENGFRVVEKGTYRGEKDASLEKDLDKLKKIEVTEREENSKHRIGAGILRKFVLKHRVRCEVTGIYDKDLLRVSHLVGWSDDKEGRLDHNNVILLSALWDAAFDCGFVSFDKDGRTIFAQTLSSEAKAELARSERISLAVSETRGSYLARHRKKHGFAI